jgi:hypothetical protein
MGAQEPTATSQPLDSISTLDSKSIDNGCLHLDRLGSPILSVFTRVDRRERATGAGHIASESHGDRQSSPGSGESGARVEQRLRM